MGILNALLTGGILVGKICQAIGGGLQKTASGDAVVVSGDVSAGGVVFFRSNATGQPLTYAYNPNTSSPASVVIPNDHNDGGITYVIAPTEKIVFAEADSPNVSPSTVVTTGLTNAPKQTSGPLQVPGGSFFKMAFSGLQLGKIVNVGSFRISCTTAQLVIISSQVSIISLTYMYLNSNKGVVASSTATIPKDPSEISAEGENTSKFTINFSDLGFNLAGLDTLDGTLTLAIEGTTKEILALSKVASTPLHPQEIKALTHYQNLA